MARNPNWTRDELILALELYFKTNPLHTSKNHPDIVNLSELLNSLPIHFRAEQEETFRNPDGVYMKLCNFLRFDPSYEGEGLSAGSKLDEEIWSEFSTKHSYLSETADAIRRNFSGLTSPQSSTQESELVNEDEEFPEGRILTRIHKQKERSSTVVRKKKTHVLNLSGKLVCEACDFDFADFYGDLGQGFAECHHNLPLSTIQIITKIKMSDLSIVCSNCHRMLHRIRPWIKVEQLKQLLVDRSKTTT